MTDLPWWAYIIVFGAPAVLTIVLTPVAIRIARRLQMFDMPSARKSQKTPVPYLGGAAIVAAFTLIVLAATLIWPPSDGAGQVAGLLGMALGLAGMGLLDDMRGLSPRLRLSLETAAAVGVWALGTRADLLPGHADILPTIAWIVVVTNAFNLLDNMDGLSAGVASIAAVYLFIVAFLNGQFLVASLAASLAGCGAGFLRHNFHPARIYMGDAGSLFLGFLMAVISLRLRTHATLRVSFFIPILILGVPLFDTALVTVTRVWHGRSPFLGGRDHVSHRLARLGLPVRAAVSLIYATSIALGWLAVIDMRIDRNSGLMLVGLTICVACFLAVLLAFVPVYDRRSTSKPTEMSPNTEGLFSMISAIVSERFQHDRLEVVTPIYLERPTQLEDTIQSPEGRRRAPVSGLRTGVHEGG